MTPTTSFLSLGAAAMLAVTPGCDNTSDDIQRAQQEKILQEGTSAIGMPSIKNFREKRILKDIIEMRDQDGILTYTYIVAEMSGKLIFLGESIGYGIPASTQFTNPQKIEYSSTRGTGVIAQADPNGLFSPQSAEGTWVMLKDAHSNATKPVYIEPRVIVSPFKLSTE